MTTILFQGDSITDAERLRDQDAFCGHGYATLVSARLGFESPSEYKFINRGVKNNTVVDLYNRRENDILSLKPDVISILIGVNDAAVHNCTSDKTDYVTVALYEETYSKLINKIFHVLPNIKIIMLEPFLLPGTLSSRNRPDIYPSFRQEVELRANSARHLAENFELPFIELQNKFDAACKKAPADYWLFDGVHPTAAGHELIAREWIQAFNNL